MKVALRAKKDTKPDIAKARRFLNWELKVKLKDGLKTTIEWFKNHAQKEKNNSGNVD